MTTPVTAQTDDDRLAGFLDDRDVPCPRCGYNLRGARSGRCPECGDRLTLQVGLVEPRLGAYVALLVGASLGFGGGGLFGLVALFQAPSDWWSSAAGIALFTLTVVGAIALLLVLVLRRRIRRRSHLTQWLLAAILWIAVVAISTVVVTTFSG
ncbi:MAG: hypothetical protein ACYTGG_09610 [Planctomycetota bacterium]|jgi:hypothetical protein